MKQFYNKRNQEIWQQSVEKQEALLVGYLIAGDPSFKQSLNIVQNSVLAGIDILELGVPSQNPYLDGEEISNGHARVNQNSTNWLLNYWKVLRQQVNNPIWAMGYKEDLYNTSLYLDLARWGLVDALVLPDCIYEERNLVELAVKEYGVDVVQFVQPTMPEHMLAQICRQSTIIYAQSYVGATGDDPDVNLEDLAHFYNRIRSYTDALIVTGFGFRTPDKVRSAIESGFDGAVVGSALVSQCGEVRQDKLYQLISAMKRKTDLIYV